MELILPSDTDPVLSKSYDSDNILRKLITEGLFSLFRHKKEGYSTTPFFYQGFDKTPYIG